MDGVQPDMERKRHQTPRCQHAGNLGKRTLRLLPVEVDDRIERHDAGERLVGERQREHVADHEVEPGR